MTTPRRENYDTIIGDLTDRVARLERSLRSPTIFVANSSAPPPEPAAGGLLYVEAGALHYLGPSGTDTTIAPA